MHFNLCGVLIECHSNASSQSSLPKTINKTK